MERSCCAQGNATEESTRWASDQFGDARLGDSRRSRRLVGIAAAMAENPAMSLPKQLPEWSDLMGAYRFFSNEDIDPREILRPHYQKVRQEAAGHPVVLCVQDDTELDFTCRTGISGLGITGDGVGRGLLQHGALAVLPDKRLLGVLHLAWHAIEPARKGEKRSERNRRWTKPDVWQEAAQAVGCWPAGSTLIHVGDRHADLFRFMRQAIALGHGLVVRAMHDRKQDDQTRTLWQTLESQPPLGHMSVELGVQRDKGNRIKREGRTALLTIRSAPVIINPPVGDARTRGAQLLSLWAVHVAEEHPPEGKEPVEWMLLSTLEAGTLAQAQVIIGYYTCRWMIEEWHRCLKQGCRIEASQLDEAADIQRLCAIDAVLAVRLLQMRELARGEHADSPAALASLVPAMYIMIVAGLGKVEPERLTPELFWKTVAKRGGWLGRKHDGRPGWIVLWRGWSDIVQMVHGAETYRQMLDASKKSV
jgi:hypothetical protein